jgi:glycosyltransferase involved in cell wall biosynthesis
MQSIMFYINSLRRGGAERVFATLANSFTNAGYDVTFVTSFRKEMEYPLDIKIHRYSIENTEIKQSFWKRNISRTKKLRRFVHEIRPDVLLSTSPESNFRSVLSVLGLGTKIVISIVSDPKKEYQSKAYRFLAKTLYHLADGTVFQTAEEKEWFPKAIQNKSAILYNQIDESFFQQPKCTSPRNIGAVGRLVPIKCHNDIIRAFSDIADRIDDDLIIYGDGECREELENLVMKLNLQNRVFLPGNVNNVAETINGCKLFIHASEYEGLPNALMEAMALGIPCIATDSSGGGARELLDEGEAGRLVSVHDVDALSKEMLRLLIDDSYRNALAQKSKKKALTFRPDVIFKEWEKYLKGISLRVKPNDTCQEEQ